jgi:hypothetical protein
MSGEINVTDPEKPDSKNGQGRSPARKGSPQASVERREIP